MNKIVLAYSGGLDTSVMLRWLKERYNCEVVCYCADVGQGEEMDGLEAKALATGASKLHIEDLREEFVREYVWTAVKANAIYEGVYLMGTSLARPVIAKRQIEIAGQEAADPVALLSKLNELGGLHGIGRIDLVENRFVGMKSRGVYETPGVTILQVAHRALESITLDREVMHLRDSLSVKFAESVYYGFWFAPEFDLMRKMIDETQQPVSGDVRLKLYRGNVIVVGRRSPNSLYDERVATFEADTVYNQRDAEGFIKLNALRLRLRGGQH